MTVGRRGRSPEQDGRRRPRRCVRRRRAKKTFPNGTASVRRGRRSGRPALRAHAAEPAGGRHTPVSSPRPASSSSRSRARVACIRCRRRSPPIREMTRRAGVPLLVDEVQTASAAPAPCGAARGSGSSPTCSCCRRRSAEGCRWRSSSTAPTRQWGPGAHAGTFRGNQLAMAAGEATMRHVAEDLPARADAMGQRLRRRCAPSPDRRHGRRRARPGPHGRRRDRRPGADRQRRRTPSPTARAPQRSSAGCSRPASSPSAAAAPTPSCGSSRR